MDGKRGGSKPRYTAEKIIPCIHGTYGNLTEIAERVGCTRATIARAIERDQEIADAIEQEKEWFKDQVEDVYKRRLMSGEATWPELKHFLETQMRDRGYGKISTNEGSLSVKVQLRWPDRMEEAAKMLESGEEVTSGGWELVPPEGDDGKA